MFDLKVFLPITLLLACGPAPETYHAHDPPVPDAGMEAAPATTPEVGPGCRVEVATRFALTCPQGSNGCYVDTYADVETRDEFPGRHDLNGCTDAQGTCQVTCQPPTPCDWPGPPAVWRDGAWRLPDGTVAACP